MTMPDAFTIIVLYHTGETYLKLCLESLLQTTRPTDEILVVINNENVDAHTFTPYDSRVRYVHFYENLGHAKAGNKGVELARNEYVIISDHDLIFFPNWLEASWQLYSSDMQIGATSCQLIDPYQKEILDFGIAFSGYNFAHPHLGLPMNHPLVSQDRIVQMACTGGFLIAKKLFETLGGFTEAFGTLYTDLDICLRMKREGFKIGVVAGAKAYHFAGDLIQDNRAYKRSHLKADVKGVFMKNNATVLSEDIDEYYWQSWIYLTKTYDIIDKEFFFCNNMSVVNPTHYEDLSIDLGIKPLGKLRKPSETRDASYLNMLKIWGYDFMALGSPILHFVDRFSCLRNNSFWWSERANKTDLVMDRNGNLLFLRDLLN